MKRVFVLLLFLFLSCKFCLCYWDCEWDSLNKETSGDITLNEMLAGETSVVKTHFLFLIRAYQILFSSKSEMECNFHPSCSRFTFYSIKKYGGIKGVLMGLDRINRCNPLSYTDYYDIDVKRSLLSDPIENESLFDSFFEILNF